MVFKTNLKGKKRMFQLLTFSNSESTRSNSKDLNYVPQCRTSVFSSRWKIINWVTLQNKTSTTKSSWAPSLFTALITWFSKEWLHSQCFEPKIKSGNKTTLDFFFPNIENKYWNEKKVPTLKQIKHHKLLHFMLNVTRLNFVLFRLYIIVHQ